MTTATELKKLPTAPPQPTAMAVKAHKRTLILALDALKLGAAEAALQAARGGSAEAAALARLHGQIRVTEFEIELNDQAVALAMSQDRAKEADWRSAEQTMDVEDVIEGLSKGGCCTRCTPGVHCVITAPDPNSGGTCGHPELSKHLQYRDESGRRFFRYEGTPRALEIYKAACRKLKVEP
jgi:hypothetical protein